MRIRIQLLISVRIRIQIEKTIADTDKRIWILVRL